MAKGVILTATFRILTDVLHMHMGRGRRSRSLFITQMDRFNGFSLRNGRLLRTVCLMGHCDAAEGR